MVFNRCCFCCRLQTGAVILGWLGIVTYMFYIILATLGFFNLDTIASKIQPPNSDFNLDEWKLKVEIFLGCLFVVSLINLLAAAMLILGVVKENRYLLLPWLIGGMTSITFTTITVLSSFHLAGENPGAYVFTWVAIGFELYLWLCVYSLFREFRIQATHGQGTSLLSGGNKPHHSAWNYQTI